VNGACPDALELERLLAEQLSAVQEKALEAHVAGCAACQLRLEGLTRAEWKLPGAGRHATDARQDAPGPDIEENLLTRLRAPAETPSASGRPAPPTAKAPIAFGRYQVRQTIGSGGFGTVYLGHDEQLDRPVAIKSLRSDPSDPQVASEPFLQEARRLARLSHPGIVAVHDVGTHEGQVYIVSDFLDGPNLSEWLKTNRPGWRESAGIVAAVADALAHAHARSIVHRDVKPANILFTADHRPVLVDFGMGLDESHAGGQEKGVIGGTPWYMSPEQVAGEAHRIDGRTDVYSLGVVLYEMLCGRLPFRSNSTLELFRQVREDEPQPPRQLVRDVPPDLERACLKALAKRTKDRYTTAADFADDLRQVLQAAADSARMASPPSSALLPTPGPAAPTPLPRQPREAERRQVTVLVCGSELFESEELLRCLDAEDQARLLWELRQVCEPAVSNFDGAVVQCDHKGLLVCFGYPVAHEDAAPRAVRAGLAILDDLKGLGDQLRQEHRLELSPWVGIHTGPAIVEAREGTIGLVGEARTVAGHLEEVAERGQVVCTELTHRLLRGKFDCARVARRKLRGLADAVDLFRVQGTAPAGAPFETARENVLTPLTGRDQEVALLRDRWKRAQEGMGQVVLLIGEPGLGKSRLVHALEQHVQEQGGYRREDAPVIEWRCSPHHQNTPLYPAIELFERALGFGRDEAPSVRFERMVRRLKQDDLDRPGAVSLFASLLSLPTDDRYPALALAPVRQREETFRALLEWLHVRAARRPTLFVVEDLHWVDASTAELLGRAVGESRGDRLLIVLTFRPEYHPPWAAFPHQTSLALTSLTRAQMAEMVRERTGKANLAETVIDQLFERTGGVPLFVEELTKMMQESGAIEQAGQDSAHARSLLTRVVPATLQDLVMARLDRMAGDREPAVANAAAVLGRELSGELLAAVAAVDEATLQAELAKLVAADILYVRGQSEPGRPYGRRYVFKHALLQDAIYNSLVKSKRQHYHRRIAEVFEAQFPQALETQPELLAHHCTEAGLTEKAVGYWLRAGLRARARFADVEAVGHLTRGLALLATLPESPERDARELEFLGPLGTAYIAARGYAAPEVGPVFQRAGELSRALCTSGEQTPQLFAILWGNFAWHVVRGEFRHCMGLAGEAMALAERADDAGMRMEALFLLGLTLLYRGDFAGARDHCARALANYDDRARTQLWASRTGQDAGVTHRCYLALALWHLGRPDQALKVNREMLELARALGQPFSLEYALHHTGWLHQHCRLATVAQVVGEEAIRIATEQGLLFWHATGTLYKAAGLLLEGQGELGLPLFREGLRAYRATGAGLALPYYLSILGAALTQAGQFAEARQVLDEALIVVEKNDDRFQEAELHRLKGELLLAQRGDEAGAEGCFHRAIATAQRQQGRAWELRATMSLARLRRKQGRGGEGRAALAAVYATYTEGLTTPDLEDAAALLGALAEAPPPAPPAQEPAPMEEPALPGRRALTRRKFLVGAGALLTAAGGWAGYSYWARRQSTTAVPSGEPIRVGILHSQTGTMHSSEVPVLEMTQLTLEDINHHGGLLGRPIEYVIRDGASDERIFAREAERLIQQDHVCVIFGCWTSASRKAVKAVVEKRQHLLVYPVQYEGVESSPHIVYTGAAPNQQLLPAVDWCCERKRGAKFFLAGSDYIFPHTAHAILRHRIEEKGGAVVGEQYLLLGDLDARSMASAIKKARPDFILNTVNGSSNLGLFSALRAEDIKPQDVPTISFSVDEQLLQGLSPRVVAGDYAAWAYFAAIPGPRNEEFVKRYKARWGELKPVTGPMEAAYLSVRFWAQAVTESGTEAPGAVRLAIGGQSLDAPEGPGVRVDPDNQHTWKYFHLGQITPEGKFRIVVAHDAPLPPEPYLRYRSRSEWEQFQMALYRRWGNRWSRPSR
jgi:urea ABC transporter urea binding protein